MKEGQIGWTPDLHNFVYAALILATPFKSHIIFKDRALGSSLLHQKEIAYISASKITTAVETRPPQLHDLLYFSPSLPSLSFYEPPSPSSATVCETRTCISS